MKDQTAPKEEEKFISGGGRSFHGEVPNTAEMIQPSTIGEGRKLIFEKKVKLSKEFAEKMLGLAEIPGDRGLRERHVEYLCACAQNKTWQPRWVRIVTASNLEEDGKEYRCNGQHTCWMRLEMGDTYDKSYGDTTITHEHYECKTLNDIRVLYGMIDRNAARGRANVMDSYLIGSPEFEGYNKDALRRLGQGFTFWNKGVERTDASNRRDPAETAVSMLTEYQSLSQTVLAIYTEAGGHAENYFLRRAPVIGAMYATAEKSAKVAAEFWARIGDGTDMKSASDPRLKLRNALMKSKLSVASGGNTKRISDSEMYNWCIFAWNAYRRGEELTVLKGMPNSKRPTPR